MAIPGPELRWQERCDRYFSSMDDLNLDLTKLKRSGQSRKRHRGHKHRAKADHSHHITTFSNKKQPCEGSIKWLSGLDLHGTSMLLRTQSVVYFMFWFILSLAACVVFSVFVYIFVTDYLKAETVMKTKLSEDSQAPHQLSIAICNANPLKSSTVSTGSRFLSLKTIDLQNLYTLFQNRPSKSPVGLKDLLKNTKLEGLLSYVSYKDKTLILEDLQQEYELYSQMASESDWENTLSASLDLSTNPLARVLRLTRTEMETHGPNMEDELLVCTKNGRPCQFGEISYHYIQDLGHCAQIQASLDQSWFDSLSMVLDAEPEEYMTHIAPAPGFRIFVTPTGSGSLPSLSSSVEVGVGTDMKILVEKIREVTYKSKNCNAAKDYSKQNCIAQCLENLVTEICDCSLSLENLLPQRCQVDLQYEFVCHRFLEALAQRGELPCENCPAECTEEQVILSPVYNALTDHSQEYIKTLLNAAGVTKNFSDIRNSLVRLTVQPVRSQYEILEEEDAISLISLLLKIGALSAITVGVSVVTGVEIIWLFGKAIITLCCAAVKNREESNEVEVLTPYATEPRPHWFAFDGTPLFHEQGPEIVLANGYPFSRINTHTTTNYRELEEEPPSPENVGGAVNQAYDPNGDESALNPILEDSRETPVRAADEPLDSNNITLNNNFSSLDPNALYSHPWARSGESRPYPRVVMTNEASGDGNMPVPNAPDISLRELLNSSHRTADEPPPPPPLLLETDGYVPSFGQRDRGHNRHDKEGVFTVSNGRTDDAKRHDLHQNHDISTSRSSTKEKRAHHEHGSRKRNDLNCTNNSSDEAFQSHRTNAHGRTLDPSKSSRRDTSPVRRSAFTRVRPSPVQTWRHRVRRPEGRSDNFTSAFYRPQPAYYMYQGSAGMQAPNGDTFYFQ